MFFATNEIRTWIGSRISYQNEAKHLLCQHLENFFKTQKLPGKARKIWLNGKLAPQRTRAVALEREIFAAR
jgi:hypothetical protein